MMTTSQLRTLHAETEVAYQTARLHGYGGLKWELLWCMLSLEIAIRDFENDIYSYTTAHTAMRHAEGLCRLVAGMHEYQQLAKVS